MEKKYRLIKRLRLLAVPLGLLMFVFTREGFGFMAATALGMLATIAFDMIVRKELNRMVSEELIMMIETTIKRISDVQNIVEMQRMSGGFIARIYLVNAAEKTVIIQKAIKNSIDNCSLKKYIWAMQLTNMSELNSLNDARKALNKQLLEELKRKDNEK